MSKETTNLSELLKVMKRGNFIILDTETTALDRGEIVEIALIDHNGNPLFKSLVKPVKPIPQEATAVHGIDNDDVRDAPGFALVAPLILDIVTNKDVITYNAVYDRKMLHLSAEAAGIEKIDWKVFSRWHCAMEAFAEFFGDWNSYHGSYRWQPLGKAATFCNVPKLASHRAMADCLLTLGVCRYMEQESQGV